MKRLAILILLCCATFSYAQIPAAPNDWATDDVITLIYDPVAGSLALDNPAGDDAAADAITTLEIVSSVDFFTGPAPPEINGLFDVWSPQKAFRLLPDGFYDMAWADGTVETGIFNLCEILTVSGRFSAAVRWHQLTRGACRSPQTTSPYFVPSLLHCSGFAIPAEE